jgi:hypothetical protein
MFWALNYGTVIIGFLFSLYAFCTKFLMIKSEYDSYSTPNVVKKIYSLICDEMLFCNKKVIWKNKQCPSGLIVGKGGRFIAHIDMYKGRNDMELEIELYTFRCFKNPIESLVVDNIAEIEQGALFDKAAVMQMIPLLYKRDVQHDSSWGTMDIVPFRSYDEIPKKSVEVCEAIMERIKDQGYFGGVYLFCGPPGVGKSMTTRLLAVNTNATLCSDFNPSKPANKLTAVISACQPVKNNPMIIVIEEVDKVFARFGNITEHNKFSIQVKDKDDWNNMLDFVGMVNNVVLVLTSNMSLVQLQRKFDLALTRNYRVTECFAF